MKKKEKSAAEGGGGGRKKGDDLRMLWKIGPGKNQKKPLCRGGKKGEKARRPSEKKLRPGKGG